MELENAANTEVIQSDSQSEQRSETKDYSERLKKDRAKIASEVRNEVAESFGYSSWEEYVSAQTDSKLLDSGLEPETVKPLLKDLLKNDPEYKEAMKFKQEKEELEQKIWAKSELDTLNTKFGTSYSDVSELGENVVKLWNSGLTLDKAFAAENFEIIKENAIKKAKIADSGKGHLKPVTGGVINSSDIRKPSADELRYFKAFMPNLTEEQIVEKLNKK